MRRWWIIPIITLMLSGCVKQESFETVTDKVDIPIQGKQMQILVDMPDDASLQTLESNEDCAVYICDDYTLTIYTTQAGDIQKTIRNATGFLPEQLEIIQTQQGNSKKYVCAWTAAGESGEQVGRCAVLDDGSYHYILTAMANATKAGNLSQNEWLAVFRSFRLIDPDEVVSSGS